MLKFETSQEHYEIEADENRAEVAKTIYERYLRRDVSAFIEYCNG
jgi:hypothetical protein